MVNPQINWNSDKWSIDLKTSMRGWDGVWWIWGGWLRSMRVGWMGAILSSRRANRRYWYANRASSTPSPSSPPKSESYANRTRCPQTPTTTRCSESTAFSSACTVSKTNTSKPIDRFARQSRRATRNRTTRRFARSFPALRLTTIWRGNEGFSQKWGLMIFIIFG